MKRILVLLACLAFFDLHGQNMEAIIVNENNSATLSFAKKIDFVVFGNNPSNGDGSFLYYDFFKDGKICVIRGNRKDAPTTSLTVKLEDDSVWYGIVTFGEDTKIFYDFRGNDASEPKPVASNDRGTSNPRIPDQPKTIVSDANSIDLKLEKLKVMRKEYFTIGERIGDVTFSVSNIRNDNNNTYLILSVNNQSGNIYSIDGILFKFLEGKRAGVKKGEARIEERIMPLSVQGNLNISAYSNDDIGIAIPLYAIGRSGKLEITVREKEGTRNVIIGVPGSVMSKVKVFSDEK